MDLSVGDPSKPGDISVRAVIFNAVKVADPNRDFHSVDQWLAAARPVDIQVAELDAVDRRQLAVGLEHLDRNCGNAGGFLSEIADPQWTGTREPLGGTIGVPARLAGKVLPVAIWFLNLETIWRELDGEEHIDPFNDAKSREIQFDSNVDSGDRIAEQRRSRPESD